MKDEEYVYQSDCREKKNIANSARHKRTHCGKGGRVKFPSDYKTRKELQAMNGEVKTYKMNSPMKWDEFKALPDDIKIMYIKLIRQKFNAPGRYIAEMMGIGYFTFAEKIRQLGINEGKTRGRCTPWDKDGFFAWCNGAPVPATDPVEETPEAAEQPKEERQEETVEDVREPEPVPVCVAPIPEINVLQVAEEKPKAIPNSGSMVFEGSVESIMNTISALLGGADVHISITWDVIN